VPSFAQQITQHQRQSEDRDWNKLAEGPHHQYVQKKVIESACYEHRRTYLVARHTVIHKLINQVRIITDDKMVLQCYTSAAGFSRLKTAIAEWECGIAMKSSAHANCILDGDKADGKEHS
jgi:hypothetical protein